MNKVWIFHGVNSRFGNAVFTDINIAKAWIKKYKLSGIVTLYPLDISIYDWAIESGFFKPKEPKHLLPDFIEKFTSASQEHYHFENGEME